MSKKTKTKTKTKTFKFSSSQSDWLKKFGSRYLSIEDNDPHDTAGELSKFVEDTYVELTQKYTVGESFEKDIIIEVSILISIVGSYPN